MSKTADRPAAHVELIPAQPEDEAVLANLVQLYAHDFSEFYDLEFGADGRFEYKDLPLYWREPDRHPFLITVDGTLAGFVLLKRGPQLSGDKTVWDMAEFFVIRGFRRHGIGTQVAHKIWGQHPGRWEVRVLRVNRAGCGFWEHAIELFVGHTIEPVNVEKGGDDWQVFSFGSDSTP